MAGIEDCYTVSRGSTKTLGNFVKVCPLACIWPWLHRKSLPMVPVVSRDHPLHVQVQPRQHHCSIC